MSGMNNKPKSKKTIYAPPPSDPSLFTSIYSIEIDQDEEVEWQWLELPDGNKVIIDYKIICQSKTKVIN